MKKLFFVFSVLTQIFTSCSSNSEPAPEDVSGPELIKKIIINSPDGTILITDFTYVGTKIINETSSDGKSKTYSYTNNLITGVVVEQDDVVTEEWSFEYDENQRVVNLLKVRYTYPSSQQGIAQTFTYNLDGTVSMLETYGTITEQNSFSYSGAMYLDSHGQLIEFDNFTESGDLVVKVLMTYDAKNSLYKNITGYSQLPWEYRRAGHFNNAASYVDYYGDEPAPWHELAYSYQYNANNYPTSLSTTNEGGEVTNIQYFYE